MKFDIVVGNPPYGIRTVKGGSSDLHLKIMKTVLDFCTDRLCFIMPSKPIIQQLNDKWYNMFKNAVCTNIDTVKKGIFPNTNMDATAIYYVDRNANSINYCKKLDVDDTLYNAIDNKYHKLFIDIFDKQKPIKIKFQYKILSKEEDLNNIRKNINDDKFYLNVNMAGIKPDQKGETQWISNVLANVDILTKDEELDFLDSEYKRRTILECPNKEYGINLKNLMLNGFSLKYGLWLTQTNQNIVQAQFRYVPDVDYTNIDTDEKLLSVCGVPDDDIDQMMTYLKNFNFERNRNDVIRGTEEEPDSSPSGSEPSKTVLDN